MSSGICGWYCASNNSAEKKKMTVEHARKNELGLTRIALQNMDLPKSAHQQFISYWFAGCTACMEQQTIHIFCRDKALRLSSGYSDAAAEFYACQNIVNHTCFMSSKAR
jgi:hypothetical protein